MKPVFKEEMEFLEISSKYTNLLWVDKRAYRGFDKDLNLIKFGRNIEKLPKDVSNLITHKEFCQKYYKESTLIKVERERERLKKYLQQNKYEEYIISVSGGKDSTVCGEISMEVLKELGIEYRILFGNTSNETHHTYRYVKKTYKEKLEIANPKEGFYHWVNRTGYVPTRFGRACCSIFKEGNITDYLNNDNKIIQILGLRRDESKNRSKYPQKLINTKWDKKQKENWIMYFPIIEFSDLDVWGYILYNNIEFNPLYKFGYGRVGCTNCPYRSEYELSLNKHFLTSYDKRWKGLIEKIFNRDGLAINMNCTCSEFTNGAWNGGIVRQKPTHEVIQNYANYKGISFESAKKFFISNRCRCGKRLSKDIVALNMKMFGRNTEARMCLKCMSKHLEVSKQELKKQIQNFKDEGCNLF